MINDLVKNGFQTRPVQPVKAAAVSGVAPAVPETVEALQEAPPAQTDAPKQDQLQNAVSKLQDYVQNYQRKLSFSVSEETGRTVIKVYDAETDELIRQIPPEETLRLAELIDSHPDGLFVQERA
jgi:flagellar protein FlaG